MGKDRQPADIYDVAILGGGPTGLTLGLQLKQARPETSVFIAEKRVGPAQTDAAGLENLFMEAVAQPA